MRMPHPMKGTSRTAKVVAGIAGSLLVAGTAYAVTGWTVGLATGSSAGSQAATVSNISITATTPITDGTTGGTISNQLYPGSTGDVVLTISNPNLFPVAISTITTPSTGAAGFTDSSLSSANSSCTAALSTVTWAGTAGAHTLNGGTALVVAAKVGSTNGSLIVTLTNAAAMGSAPTACEGSYFSMPSLTATNAASTTSSATTSPTVSSYT